MLPTIEDNSLRTKFKLNKLNNSHQKLNTMKRESLGLNLRLRSSHLQQSSANWQQLSESAHSFTHSSLPRVCSSFKFIQFYRRAPVEVKRLTLPTLLAFVHSFSISAVIVLMDEEKLRSNMINELDIIESKDIIRLIFLFSVVRKS